jgi:hypothetical protein
MFNSAALEVVVGLIFIYLLYSLLATILSEMIASFLGLRSRNLKAAIGRMLNGEELTGFNSLRRIFKAGKKPGRQAADDFFRTPEIRLLGGAGVSGNPSSIRPETFSRALVGQISGDSGAGPERITAVLRLRAGESVATAGEPNALVSKGVAAYLLGLWEESGADVGKFRLLIEAWFDRCMEQATEWYKRRIQLVLLVLGFLMAWVFCADTFLIVNKLSADRVARQQLVALSEGFLKETPAIPDSLTTGIRNNVESALAGAGTILGLGSWLPPAVKVSLDPKTRIKTYTPPLDPASLSATHRKISNGSIMLSFSDRIGYFLRLAYNHFFGFLITAIAVSLGAPFWFDLLNKVMNLRTAFKVK